MAALGEAKRRGLTRHIGVSNFTIATLAEAIRVSPEPIVTNQIEYHPYLDQTRLLAAIRGHGLAVTAYCPIALGNVVGDPVIDGIARAHGKTDAQVTLRWLIQQGDVIAIPRTSKVERLRENLEVFDFELTAEEMNSDGWPRTPRLEDHQPAGLGAGVGLAGTQSADRAGRPACLANPRPLRQSSPPEASTPT